VVGNTFKHTPYTGTVLPEYLGQRFGSWMRI